MKDGNKLVEDSDNISIPITPRAVGNSTNMSGLILWQQLLMTMFHTTLIYHRHLLLKKESEAKRS